MIGQLLLPSRAKLCDLRNVAPLFDLGKCDLCNNFTVPKAPLPFATGCQIDNGKF